MPAIKGQDLKVGDDLIFLGIPHRVTDILPYSHPVVTGGEEWETAYSRTLATGTVGADTWGMTIEPDVEYEIGPRAEREG